VRASRIVLGLLQVSSDCLFDYFSREGIQTNVARSAGFENVHLPQSNFAAVGYDIVQPSMRDVLSNVISIGTSSRHTWVVTVRVPEEQLKPLLVVPTYLSPFLRLIRFRGHVPKGGYDVPHGSKQGWPAPPPAVL
jgi:hypothetical protein